MKLPKAVTGNLKLKTCNESCNVPFCGSMTFLQGTCTMLGHVSI